MPKEHFVIRFRWLIIIGCVLAAALMGLQLRHLKIDTDPANMIPDTMRSRIDSKKIEDTFGSTDAMLVLLQTQDVLAEKTLQRLKIINDESKRIPGVKSVTSMFEMKKIIGKDGAMIVEPAVKKTAMTPAEREVLRKDLLDNELVREVVVSKDFTVAAVVLMLSLDADKKAVDAAVTKLIQDNPGDETVYEGGVPVFETMIEKDSNRDMSRLIPLALLVILLVLYGFFRQARGVLLPFAVVVLSMVFGMAVLPVLGWKLTIISCLLPIMVVAFSNNYGLYLITKYRELSRQPRKQPWTGPELAETVFKSLYQPIFFTGLITIVGILGLLSHVLVPAKQIGVSASIAIAFSLIVSLLGIPAALSLMRVPARKPGDDKQTWVFLDKALAAVSRLIIRRPRTILAVTVLFAALAAASAMLVTVDSNQENMFSKDHPFRRSNRIINEKFGGTQNIAIMFEGDIKDPALLKKMASYKKKFLGLPNVTRVTSMADVMRIMSKALNDKNEPGYNKIPQTRNAVAQYLELYSMSGSPDDFERLVDFNFEKAQMMISSNNGATPAVNSLVDRIKAATKDDKNVTAIGGYAVIYSELASTIIKGQAEAIGFALIAIVILVILLFRSFSAGALAAVPLVISILLNFGTMGVFGLKLDIATAIITSIVMGTGVDFTIQFLWKYRDMRRAGLDWNASVIETLSTTGRAIAFNAICVISGFIVLGFSSMPPLRSLALLFSVLTLACMVATLVVAPAICLLWKPRFLDPSLQSKKEVVHE